jgi:acyl-CoA reductase-like NAD-dependent aldehyde dehydrogenase
MVEISDDAVQEEVVEQTEYVTKKIMLEPRGLVLALLPSHFPIMETVDCLVPSILGGNATLLKDSPETPFFSQIFEDAVRDIAPNVVQRFFMYPQDVQSLYQDQLIDYLVFAGHYHSAVDITMELAKNDFIESNMDLGGFNVCYIDELSSTLDNSEKDKILDKIIEKCLWGVFYNSG